MQQSVPKGAQKYGEIAKERGREREREKEREHVGKKESERDRGNIRLYYE